jgi:hypothetical protein
VSDRDPSQPSEPTLLPAIVAAWCAYLVLDFLTHAVFLAVWWRATERYWLPPQELFWSIPFGYASFAIYCAALTWLLLRLYGRQPTLIAGLRFGAIAGLIYGTGSVLATYSVFRMPTSALLVWPASVTVGSTLAGVVAAWVLVADRPWRRVGLVVGAAIILFILGVVMPFSHFFFAAASTSNTIFCSSGLDM